MGDLQLVVFLERLEHIAVFLVLPAAVFLAMQYIASSKGKNKLLRALPTVIALLLLSICFALFVYGFLSADHKDAYVAASLSIPCFAGLLGCLIGKLLAKKKIKSM